MQKDEEGKKKITQWTRYLTVFIALSQAWTFALFTESIPGAISNPGFASRLIMVVTLTDRARSSSCGWASRSPSAASATA